jgi:hypothetical protein
LAGVSKADAEEVLGEAKIITENLQWQRFSSSYRLDAGVLATTSGKLLRLKGYVGRTNFSFALLYNNSPIRKYTAHHHHRNPSGEVIYGPHKHTWDDVDEDNWVYVPDNVRSDNPNDALVDFLAECNITLQGASPAQEFGFQAFF